MSQDTVVAGAPKISTPPAIRCTELEEPLDGQMTTYLTWLHDLADAAMFGNGGTDTKLGYGPDGLTLAVSVPPSLRGSLQPQTVRYNARRNGTDSSVRVELVHE